MRRLLGFALALVAAACSLSSVASLPKPAQAPANVAQPQQWKVSGEDETVDISEVKLDLAIAAIVTAVYHREQMRCVLRYDYVERDGVSVLRLRQLGPAEVAWSDSLRIDVYHTTKGFGDTTLLPRVCGDTLPAMHTHIVDNGWLNRASDVDIATKRARPQVPFHLLLSVLPGDSAILHIIR